MAHFMAVRLGIVQRVMREGGLWGTQLRDTGGFHRSPTKAEVELATSTCRRRIPRCSWIGCRVGVRAELCRRTALAMAALARPAAARVVMEVRAVAGLRDKAGALTRLPLAH